MLTQFLLERFAEQEQHPALIWKDQEYSYRWLLEEVEIMSDWITAEGLAGQLVTLEEDYSPYAAAALIALLGQGCIVLPMDRNLVEVKRQEYMKLAQVKWRLGIEEGKLFIRQTWACSEEIPVLLSTLAQEGVGDWYSSHPDQPERVKRLCIVQIGCYIVFDDRFGPCERSHS
ncbi:hypothetical protein P9222_32795 [Paenibacillus amylolyticus]|nr:hypothetical protein [Paenibacillus amylolyticus]WFR62828.1 hypothetical protein P9222_32795 [Paenibacillus amylolyticus]